MIGRNIWNCTSHVQQINQQRGWSSSNILLCMANDSGYMKMSVNYQITGGSIWPWTHVRMEPVISLTQSRLVLVDSIASICLKLFAGMVATDGIGFGGKARISTGKD